jgi:hypothetical protein
MARPITWLSRAREIRLSVAASVRSHYTRRELETIFQVQQSAAARLMEVLPTMRVGTGFLVEREAVLAFLDKVLQVEDVNALMVQLRAEKGAPVRRKMRSLVRRDLAPVGLTGLPETVKLERGRVELQFTTLDELVTDLFMLARMLDDDLEEFARVYEPVRPVTADNDKQEIQQLFKALETEEAQRAS